MAVRPLRHINKEYILKRTEEVDQLAQEIAEMQKVLDDQSASTASSSAN